MQAPRSKEESKEEVKLVTCLGCGDKIPENGTNEYYGWCDFCKKDIEKYGGPWTGYDD